MRTPTETELRMARAGYECCLKQIAPLRNGKYGSWDNQSEVLRGYWCDLAKAMIDAASPEAEP